MAPPSRQLRRRDVLIQFAATAVIGGCADTSNPPGPQVDPVDEDTGSGSDGEDTGGAGGDDTGTTGGDDDTGGTGGADDTGGSGGDDTGEVDEDWDGAECTQADAPLPGENVGLTPEMSEGPFFRDDMPERAELDVRGNQQTVLILTGRLMDSDRVPIVGAKVCLWHADDDGIYDTSSSDHHLYGYLVTGDDGSFCFKTSRPAPYMDFDRGVYNPGHLHWKVFSADGEHIFTTQHSFQDDPYLENATFPEACLLPVEELAADAQRCAFDFILEAS